MKLLVSSKYKIESELIQTISQHILKYNGDEYKRNNQTSCDNNLIKQKQKEQNSNLIHVQFIKSDLKRYVNLNIDFDELALNYDFFKNYVFINKFGISTLDWTNPLSTIMLTKAILAFHFKIKHWDIPQHSLCPTIGSRMNYLVWVNQLLKRLQIINEQSGQINGVDIGTGANLIFPLLGHSVFGWKFIATEIDDVSLQNAQQIINLNGLNSSIRLIKSKEHDIFQNNINQCKQQFAFSVCNPPFFENMDEHRTMRKYRISNVQKHEGMTEGGETQFIFRMIEESTAFRTQIQLFTCFIGRKNDFDKIKQIFQNSRQMQKIYEYHNINNVKVFTTALEQGRNTRWAIAWQFI